MQILYFFNFFQERSCSTTEGVPGKLKEWLGEKKIGNGSEE